MGLGLGEEAVPFPLKTAIVQYPQIVYMDTVEEFVSEECIKI